MSLFLLGIAVVLGGLGLFFGLPYELRFLAVVVQIVGAFTAVGGALFSSLGNVRPSERRRVGKTVLSIVGLSLAAGFLLSFFLAS